VRSDRLTVYILSDVRLYCEALAGLLSERRGLQFVGASSPGDDSLEQIVATNPRVILVDSIAARRTGVVRVRGAGGLLGRTGSYRQQSRLRSKGVVSWMVLSSAMPELTAAPFEGRR
jgi:hypothetical protein